MNADQRKVTKKYIHTELPISGEELAALSLLQMIEPHFNCTDFVHNWASLLLTLMDEQLRFLSFIIHVSTNCIKFEIRMKYFRALEIFKWDCTKWWIEDFPDGGCWEEGC